MASYPDRVRTFDHTTLAQNPSYPTLRRALNNLASTSDVPLDEFLGAVRDMAATTPYADCCPNCREVLAWPHKVTNTGGRLQCAYHCPDCSHTWTCGYSAAAPALLDQI